MGVAGLFYRTVGRRFSTTLAAAAGGVFFLDLVINKGGNAYFDSVNKGKQWKDIQPQILALQRESEKLSAKARAEDEAAGQDSTDDSSVEAASGGL